MAVVNVTLAFYCHVINVDLHSFPNKGLKQFIDKALIGGLRVFQTESNHLLAV